MRLWGRGLRFKGKGWMRVGDGWRSSEKDGMGSYALETRRDEKTSVAKAT